MAAGRILVCTLCVGSGPGRSGEMSIEINNRYCRANGYDFIAVRRSMDESKTPHWTKLLMLMEFLKMDSYGQVFYIDADAIFTDFGKRIESVPNPSGLPVTIASENSDLHARRGENTGVMLLRNCEASRRLLEDSMALYDRCKNSCVYEQDAVGICLDGAYSGLWNRLHCREINSYHGGFANRLNKPWNLWRPGDYVMHMLRESDSARLSEFARFLK